MTNLIVAAAFAAQLLPAPGGVQWEEVATDSGGRYAIDPASLVRDGDRVRFLMRADAARAEADGIDSAVVRYRFDCRARTSGVESVDFYRDGVFAHSRETEVAAVALTPIAEGSGDMQIFRRVCPAAD